MTPSETADTVLENIPPAPRAVTPAASRRAWMEPRVRLWWLSAGALAIISIAFALSQFLTWHEQSSLMRDGKELQATIWQEMDFGAGGRIPNRRIPAGQRAVLVWEVDGRQYQDKATFPDTVVSAQTVPIWVKPSDPAEWTVNSTAPPLLHQLIIPLLLLPVILIVAIIALIIRRTTLALWINGHPRQAIVVDSHRSALSPRSRQLRCSLPDSRDRRLITITLPLTHPIPAKGESITLLTPPNTPHPAVTAIAFT